MKRSMEEIWKTQSIEIPQVENLYRRKSKLTVARLQQMQKWDNRFLWLLAALVFAGFGYYGYWFLAAYSALLLAGLYAYNVRMMRALQQVQFNESVYQYLCHYLQAVRQMVRHYSRLLFWGMPLAVLPAVSWWLWRSSPAFWDFIKNNPWHHIAGLYLVVALVLGAYGWSVYRLITHLVYGSKLRQLKEMKQDIEALQS